MAGEAARGLLRRAVAGALGLKTRRVRWTAARSIPRAGAPLMAACVVTMLAQAALPTIFTIAIGGLVAAVAATTHGLHSPEGHRVILLAALVVGTFLAQQVIAPVGTLFRMVLGLRVTGAIHRQVMEASLSPVGIGHLEDPAILDQLELARGGGSAEVAPGRAADALFGLWTRKLMGWGLLLVVARFRPWLALVLLVELSISYRLYLRGLQAYTERFVANEEDFRRAAYFRLLGLGQEGAKEIRVFGLGGWVADRYRAVFGAAMGELWSRRRREALVQLVPVALDTAGIGLAFTVLAHAGVHRAITVGQLTTYAGAVLGTLVLTMLGEEDLIVAWASTAIAGAAALRTAVDARPSIAAGGTPAAALPQHEIRFEGVTFAYPGRDAVFRGLDLTIPAGRSLAIVGINGAGKTTLVKLLARLYDPDEGRVTVDGTDLRAIDPGPWQRRIAAIFQDFTRYEGYSLADNIGFGCVERAGDLAAVERAATRAGAHDLAPSLPAGWETRLARQYTDGTELSGGQWQRVALARALFATEGGAGVLVLDEPTANLDVRGETELYDRFLEVTRGVTTIVISHRFSTVRKADRIVVLDGGSVVEDGTHAELVARGGRYAEMFEFQARRYRDEDGEHVEPASA